MGYPNITQEINTIKSTYLPLSGGTLTGSINCASSKYSETVANEDLTLSNYGLNLCNSDIIGVNGLYFNDSANSYEEGINFPDGTNLYSTILATGGKLYFTPKRTFATTGTKQDVVCVTKWTSGTSGYRKYADGFIEQWGVSNGGGTSGRSITFPLAFSNTNYNIQMSVMDGSESDGQFAIGSWSNKTASSVKFWTTYNGNLGSWTFCWYCFGY